MKLVQKNPTEPHIVFAWLPVTVVDRPSGKIYTVWLEKLERKLVSIQGVPQWVYSLPPGETFNG